MAKFCGNCGAQLDDSAKVCGHCGTPLPDSGASAATSAASATAEQQKMQKYIKMGVIAVIAVIALVVVINIGGALANMVSMSTGYNGVVKTLVKDIEEYDIDSILEYTSELYEYRESKNSGWTENYFKNIVGNQLDSFEDSVGRDFKLKYEITDSYELEGRKRDSEIDTIKNFFYGTNLDEEDVGTLAVAKVTITAEKDKKSAKIKVDVVMVKESKEWKLLFIR